MFIAFQKLKTTKVTIGDNGHSNILGICKIDKNPTSFIDNVYLVNDFKYNLLSHSQLCDKGNHV